ncbi:MAG: FKBP-type peptidyl-prolyl cis-trans isomerase [Treponema sp.]|jgi:FKBP-type peptidyl-prolyl cis-trans isomerase FkpA|nr:FKBP-type peptidyl-prolyl cis-trans isomerase [Treponema sp.]
MIKNYALGALIFLAVVSLGSCDRLSGIFNMEGKSDSASAEAADKDTSYAFGLLLASQFGDLSIRFDYDEVARGLKDSMEGVNPRISLEEAGMKVQQIFARVMEKEASANMEKGNAFLTENGKKPGISITPSGLQYEVLNEGSGETPGAGDMVRVNYEGTFIDGVVFDSSYTRGEPVEFPLNQVISGWTEGLQLMRVGSSYRFFIPSNLAYGEAGREAIPPNSVLIFKIDLLDIIPQE